MHNNPSLPQGEVEICNTFLIDPQADDYELAMRFSTGIKNGDVFYTDLNGMQVSYFTIDFKYTINTDAPQIK